MKNITAMIFLALVGFISLYLCLLGLKEIKKTKKGIIGYIWLLLSLAVGLIVGYLLISQTAISRESVTGAMLILWGCTLVGGSIGALGCGRITRLKSKKESI